MPKHPLLSACVVALCTSAPALAAPAMWKVSDADSSIWIFGSVHLLPPGLDWRTGAFDKVLSKAERVYFETDVSTEAQMEIMPLTFDMGFNRDGTLLSETIGPKLTERMRAAAEAYALPMPSLLTMKPWMAATTISMGPMMDSGFDPLLGVETVLAQEVSGDRVGYLETPQEQIMFLAGGSIDEQIVMLEATLDTLDIMKRDMEGMIDAWMAGEPEQLGEIFVAQMGDYDDGMVERIIDQRNYNWVEKIETMLARNEKALLVVGAAHMVGDVSVVRLLEEKGFTSSRVQ
jgi:uncharacterized protein